MHLRRSIQTRVRLGAVAAVFGGAVLLSGAPVFDAGSGALPWWLTGQQRMREVESRRTMDLALACLQAAARNLIAPDAHPAQAALIQPTTAATTLHAQPMAVASIDPLRQCDAQHLWILRLTHLPPPAA
jgi:hypothetical protein